MLSSLDGLIRLLDEQDRLAASLEAAGIEPSDELFDGRDTVEREILQAKIQCDGDAAAKLRYLAHTMGDGERRDGLDIAALQGLSAWMDTRFEVGKTTSNAIAA